VGTEIRIVHAPEMNPFFERDLARTRRHFFGRTASGIGTAALASLLGKQDTAADSGSGGLPGFPNFAPKAKRVIYLMQGGAPSHVDLLDWKPGLYDKYGEQLPDDAKTATNERIAAVNEVKDGENIDAIRAATEELTQYLQTLGGQMYQDQGDAAAGPAPDGDPQRRDGDPDEDVVDAEYTEQ